jgi:hypothetical protein
MRRALSLLFVLGLAVPALAEQGKCDSFKSCSSMGVTNDAALTLIKLRVDPVSNALIVTTATGGGGAVGEMTADGSVLTNFPTYVNATTKPLVLTTTGHLRVSFADQPEAPTYSCSITGLVVAANATDIFTLTGTATKSVRLRRVECYFTETVAAGLQFSVTGVVRSTADTVGTFTNPVAVPHANDAAAATAVCTAYTVNPTAGTGVGNVRTARIWAPGTTNMTAGVQPAPVLWQWLNEAGTFQPIVLRGAASQFAVNVGAGAVASVSADCSFEWTEQQSAF